MQARASALVRQRTNTRQSSLLVNKPYRNGRISAAQYGRTCAGPGAAADDVQNVGRSAGRNGGSNRINKHLQESNHVKRCSTKVLDDGKCRNRTARGNQV